MELYVGLMSGTSMDGIDVALVEQPSNKLIHGATIRYSDNTRKSLEQLMKQQACTLAHFSQLNTVIGKEFAEAVNQLLAQTGYSYQSIRAIGSHGQTVSHDAKASPPYTIQLGCPHTISSLTGIDVVADFRTRDLVNGGEGAPFAPLYHQELFMSKTECRVIANIGGISNLSFLDSNEPVIGWDVGPGNCLMDAWIALHQDKEYDDQGFWASQGSSINDLLNQLLSDPFFSLATPKSIGKEYFSLAWLNKYLKKEYQPVDVQATLLQLTAVSIAESIVKDTKSTNKLYLCGGGAHNEQLKNSLSRLLPDFFVGVVDDLGVNSDYLEAMMFAWLAAQTIHLTPVDLSSITGSRKKQILGAIYPIS